MRFCTKSKKYPSEQNTPGYDSLINIPKRKKISTATCIDHIYEKSTAGNLSVVLGMIVSEYDAIFCSLIDQRTVSHLKVI